MCWLRRMHLWPGFDQFTGKEGMDSEEEKRQRISTLSGDEQRAFEWFRQGYTARWTAETMLLDKRTAKRLFGALFHKLGVANETEVCKLYRVPPLQPKDAPREEDGL